MDEISESLFCRLEGHFGIYLQVNSYTVGRLDMMFQRSVWKREALEGPKGFAHWVRIVQMAEKPILIAQSQM
jgi:hypothetical protein